jgi:predicted Zn-dependent protease
MYYIIKYQDYFYKLADFIDQQLQANEVYLCDFAAEKSDFVRFNKGKIRQPGNVQQAYINIDLIQNQRHATGKIALSGDMETDKPRITSVLSALRDQLPHIPDDPYLLYATEINSSESIASNSLPAANEVVNEIYKQIQADEFVGIYAAGGIYHGFANSLGQRNWYSCNNFNLDWSFYYDKDKAVKSAYAGFDWNNANFQSKVSEGLQQLEILKRKSRTIKPGKYRVYLSPAALHEILQLLSWGGFGLKSQQTKNSALLRMLADQNLDPSITLIENIEQGIAPNFQSEGFIKPAQITLIEKGIHKSALISPRSAKEYDVITNGANNEEAPMSLDLAAGNLAKADILSQLDTGIYINNLWYLNYSDKSACRMTGMTRFATFWVENGEIVAPLNVMRFDETLYRILGEQLIGLTQERDFIMDSDTYYQRSTSSARLPGALVDGFTFTL